MLHSERPECACQNVLSLADKPCFDSYATLAPRHLSSQKQMKILLYAVAATTVLAIWIVYRKKSTGKDAKSVELELAGAVDGAGAGDFLRLISPKLDVTALTTIDLKNAGLLTLPGSIGNAVNLVKLDLGGNPELTDLPDELAHCTKLKVLFILGARKMKEVPRVLGRMTHLTRLGLKSNGIVKIADDAL